MDYQFEKDWQELTKKLEAQFEMPMDLDGVLFLIGVQELGQGFKVFKKDEKMNLMHIAVCRLLEPYGYYEFEGDDKDGWPHFKEIKKLPHLSAEEQKLLMRKAVLEYFTQE